MRNQAQVKEYPQISPQKRVQGLAIEVIVEKEKDGFVILAMQFN